MPPYYVGGPSKYIMMQFNTAASILLLHHDVIIEWRTLEWLTTWNRYDFISIVFQRTLQSPIPIRRVLLSDTNESFIGFSARPQSSKKVRTLNLKGFTWDLEWVAVRFCGRGRVCSFIMCIIYIESWCWKPWGKVWPGLSKCAVVNS